MRKTTVIGGVVQPRYYHLWEDEIESKSVMESIVITGGIGPVIGFDIVDITKDYLSITGINLPGLIINTVAPKQELVKGFKKYLKISDRSNVSGHVVNAHITPDGLLSVDPSWLNFENIVISWADINSGASCKVIAVTARHIYEEIPDSEGLLVPLSSNFQAFDISSPYLESILTKPLSAVLAGDQNTMDFARQMIPSFNQNTDILIGLYILGNPPNILNNPDITWYLGYYNKVFPLIPYQSVWPQTNNLGFRYDTRLFNNLYTNLPASSKQLNMSYIYIEDPGLDVTQTPHLSTDNIATDKSFNIPVGTEVIGELANQSYEITPGVWVARLSGQISISTSLSGITNILDSTIRLDVETSITDQIPTNQILQVIHKTIYKTTQVVGSMIYLNFDILIRMATLTNNNKFPKIKISFGSL